MNIPPGWYPDPQHLGYVRYWNGTMWTGNLAHTGDHTTPTENVSVSSPPPSVSFTGREGFPATQRGLNTHSSGNETPKNDGKEFPQPAVWVAVACSLLIIAVAVFAGGKYVKNVQEEEQQTEQLQSAQAQLNRSMQVLVEAQDECRRLENPEEATPQSCSMVDAALNPALWENAGVPARYSTVDAENDGVFVYQILQTVEVQSEPEFEGVGQVREGSVVVCSISDGAAAAAVLSNDSSFPIVPFYSPFNTRVLCGNGGRNIPADLTPVYGMG